MPLTDDWNDETRASHMDELFHKLGSPSWSELETLCAGNEGMKAKFRQKTLQGGLLWDYLQRFHAGRFSFIIMNESLGNATLER